MKGYKATDANMKCRGFQFELGKWFEHEGEMVECQSGFHFCEQPSGPWAYYSEPGTRIFEVETDDVQEKPLEAGADFKRVCRRIRLVREVTPGGNSNTGNSNTGYRNTGNSNTGDRNTGYRNTGNSNTGDRNTGYRNTGDSNTGDSNTGYSNTGYRNTGDRNTGDRNTGDSNTGDSNTGDRNTGDRNTGERNTGDRNTGDSNTGDSNTGDRNTGLGNATNYSAGYFCVEEPKVISFDVQTELTRLEFDSLHSHCCYQLSAELCSDEPISFEKYEGIPGITEDKLRVLHQKHIDARRK